MKKKLAQELTPRIEEIIAHIHNATVDGGFMLRIEEGWEKEWDEPCIEVVDLVGGADPFWINWSGSKMEDVSVGHFLPTPEERAEFADAEAKLKKQKSQ